MTEAKIWSAALVHLKGLDFVVRVDEGTDVGLELSDGSVNTSLDLLSGELSEPAFDLIDSWRGSRREVDMIMRPTGEPRFDPGCLVGGVVDGVDAPSRHRCAKVVSLTIT
ncbi:hypothetical protein WN73_12255 [Bradyrhizobium sp. CCBAU 45394]|nr:hypothetical protein [Bradyrhizobium sp. CCBAU 45394]